MSTPCETMVLRNADESRIFNALRDAGDRKLNCELFSIQIDTAGVSSLGIGVKELGRNVVTVSMLKREGGVKGAGEAAGLSIGDVIFGLGFEPCRGGATGVLQYVRDKMDGKQGEGEDGVISLQCLRCNKLCSNATPGIVFIGVGTIFAQTLNLQLSDVFEEWEAWNFVGVILRQLGEEVQSAQLNVDGSGSCILNDEVRASVLNLRSNICRAKGVRTQLDVWIIQVLRTGFHTTHDGMTTEQLIRSFQIIQTTV